MLLTLVLLLFVPVLLPLSVLLLLCSCLLPTLIVVVVALVSQVIQAKLGLITIPGVSCSLFTTAWQHHHSIVVTNYRTRTTTTRPLRVLPLPIRL